MKILHVIPSLDPKEGGPSVAVPMLASALTAAGVQVTILTTKRGDESIQVESRKEKVEEEEAGSAEVRARSREQEAESEEGGAESARQQEHRKRPTSNVQHPTLDKRAQRSVVSGQWSVVTDGIEYIYTKRSTEFYKVSWELLRWLKANVANFDLVHIHALFSFASTAAAFTAAKNNVPYIVRPLGVLNRWGLENRRAILKRASVALIERRVLTRAAAIHYTSDAERRDAGKIGRWVEELSSFICPLPVLQNGASRVIGDQLSVNRKAEEFVEKFPEVRGKRVVLFLSRIDRKKGIELLLAAFAKVRKEINDLVLVIAGSGDRDYEASLRTKAKHLEISEFTVWTGFLDGEGKAAALSAAEVFVLPSYSENFGIAAAEAMAAGVASILSDQVAIADEASVAGAILRVPCDSDKIAGAIAELLGNPDKRAQLANNGRTFAKERFSLDAVGRELADRYRAAIARR